MNPMHIPRKEIPACEPDPDLGLTKAQVNERLEGGWGNKAITDSGLTEGQIVRQNCLTFFNLVFVVMAVIMLLVGSSVLNLTFMVVVLVNAAIGCFQQIRAKRAVDKLTLVAAQKLPTVRDGKVEEVRSDLLVRDDIVEYAAGNQICADGILCTGELQVNESLITGEADAIIKRPGDELRSGSFVVAGLDWRLGWSKVSLPVTGIASVLLLVAYGLYAEVMRENAYLSRTVKVEEGQTVVDSGLYGIVRHPMYMATILLFLMIPLILGSWFALIPFAFYPVIIVIRLKDEEELLTRELPGYCEYKQKVKYRIIPFIW